MSASVRKPVSRRLKSARAYYSLAAKAMRAGQYVQHDHYYKIAERLVAEDRREREARSKLGVDHSRGRHDLHRLGQVEDDSGV